jgi:hypothetical protein
MAFSLSNLIHRSQDSYSQNVLCHRFFDVHLAGPNRRFYLALGGHWYLQWRMPADWEERVVWQAGDFMITRPETEEEAEERLEAEAEAAMEERDLLRYTAWY